MGWRSIAALVCSIEEQVGAGLLCGGADGHPLDESEWDIKGDKYRVFIQGEWIVVPDDAVISGPNKFGKAIVWLRDHADLASGEINTITRIRCFIPGSGV